MTQEIEFTTYLRGGTYHLLAYNKRFKGNRFSMTTKVPTGKKNKPKLKPYLQAAARASEILLNENKLNEETLRQQIGIILNGFGWSKDTAELYVWTGGITNGNVITYQIDRSINRELINKALREESSKTHPDLKHVVDKFLNQGSNELFGFWQDVIDGKIPLRGDIELAESSKSVKRQVVNIIKQFRPDLTFATADIQFYNDLMVWLKDKDYLPPDEAARKLPGAYSPNQRGKIIKELKAVLKLARKAGKAVDASFIDWQVTRETKPIWALTKAEVQALIDTPLTGTEKDVRDLFVMACMLGPRISDYHKMTNPDNYYVDEQGFLFWGDAYKKTSTYVEVPVLAPLQEILKDKLPLLSGDPESKLPRMIAKTNFRKALYIVAKKAGLNRLVAVGIAKKGDAIKKPIHEVITPHHSKRTFATALYYGYWGNALKASSAMQFTGHKSETVFLGYIGADKKVKQDKALADLGVQPLMMVS